MTRGFPQRLILGPLLLNILFNDILYYSEKCNLYNYDDDNVCSVAVSQAAMSALLYQI